MFKSVFYVFLFGLLVMSLLSGFLPSNFIQAGIPTTAPNIAILEVKGVIVPVIADYIDRGITQAESEGSIVIIKLNTPGGLMSSTQKIVERILNAKVPIVVYVSPAGGWAGSAGTFITLASHVAAMAPGTRIGAATPVAVEGQMPEEMKKKITEDTAAWIRSIAEMRGRNPHHAELAVREGKSYTDKEALEYNLIDLRAESLEDLISQLNGRKVILSPENVVTIYTEGSLLKDIEMSGIERFLHVLSNPNIAYLLFSLATLGLVVGIVYGMFEILPVILPLFGLGLYSLGILEANWAGVLLIAVGLALLAIEFHTPTFGFLTATGVASFTLGSLILFSGKGPGFQINPVLIGGLVALVVAVAIFIIVAIIRGQTRPQTTGREGMIGKTAEVRTPLNPVGKVFIEGELWQAQIEEGKAEPEEEVIITKLEGLKLWVKKP